MRMAPGGGASTICLSRVAWLSFYAGHEVAAGTAFLSASARAAAACVQSPMTAVAVQHLTGLSGRANVEVEAQPKVDSKACSWSREYRPSGSFPAPANILAKGLRPLDSRWPSLSLGQLNPNKPCMEAAHE